MAYLANPSISPASSAVTGEAKACVDRRSQLPWPDDLLTAFSLRMSSHGMSISRIDMQYDTRYALQQLHDARGMGDSTLTLIADELFRSFQAHQSGLSGPAH